MCEGRGNEGYLDAQSIPTTDGSRLSIRQLLILAQDRGVLFQDSERSELTAILATQGHQVILIDEDSSPGLAKLVAFLSTKYGCPKVQEVCIREHEANPEQQKNLDVLKAIIDRAGLKSLEVGLGDAHSGGFALKRQNDVLGRTDLENPFNQSGKVLVSPDLLRYMSYSVFEFTAKLCKWGDLKGEWTDQIWHAAGVESAWSGSNRFPFG